MIYQGLGLDEALDHLTRIRPVVAPNKGFMRHLRATDVSLHRLRQGS
jgi:hypothetical protein